jgi:tetratricopeptide (TPR) repeat protein
MNALARTELLTELGTVIGSQGDAAASQAVLEETFRDAEQRLGRDAEATLVAGWRFGEALRVAGNHQQARMVLDGLIARTPDHLPAVRGRLLTQSAWLHGVRMEADVSLNQAQEAVRLCRIACPPDDLADALATLANVQMMFNHARASLATWDEVLAIERREHGQTHYRVATTLDGLARSLYRLGELDRAEAIAREVIAIDEAVFDRDDWRRGSHLNVLAAILNRKRDYPAARDVARETLRIRRAALGADHPDVATDISNLGTILGAMGDYPAALDALREALRLMERAFGVESLQTALTRSNYGDVLARAGNTTGGLAALQHAVASFRQSKTRDLPEQSKATEKLARLRLDLGDGSAALALYEQMGQAVDAMGGRSTQWMARSALGRGRALLLLNRPTDARTALDEAARLAEAAALDPEPALELRLARALADHRLGSAGPQSRQRAAETLSAAAEFPFPPPWLRALTERLRSETAAGAAR